MSLSESAKAFRDTKSFCTVYGYQMAYVEMDDASSTSMMKSGAEAKGDTVLFLHGNPTSSYLWRDIMKPLQGSGRRLIAPDLIGMGDSDKLVDPSDETYGFLNQARFLDKFISDCTGVPEQEKVILVIHDWGSGLGFWWARRHPERVKGIVYMEALVQPMYLNRTIPEDQREFSQLLRSPMGEKVVLEDNMFIEAFLPNGILRDLAQEEHDVYRAPFLNAGEDRRPILAFFRSIPMDGSPAAVHEVVSNYSQWMGENEIPKLMISATPGVLLADSSLELARGWKNQKEVGVAGLHYLQEDSAAEIATAIDEWLTSDGVESVDAPMMMSSGGYSVGSSNLWFLIMMIAALSRKFW